ncbi:MAG: hypothetical protein VX619_02710 [bacterium]|nr:hypothetical protein [bacterium]
MYRLIFHLIFFYSVASLHFRNFEHHNYRQQLKDTLRTGAWQRGLKIAEIWIEENPSSHYAWYCMGRFRIEAALSKSQDEYFQLSCEAFEKAIRLYDKDPRYYYWKASTHLYLARMGGDSQQYYNFMQSMQFACDLDPMNYFYYSIFFEKVVRLFKDPLYLTKPIPRILLISSMVNSLNKYLDLKRFYAKKYLIQFCAILSENEKKYYLSHEYLHPDLRKALELF